MFFPMDPQWTHPPRCTKMHHFRIDIAPVGDLPSERSESNCPQPDLPGAGLPSWLDARHPLFLTDGGRFVDQDGEPLDRDKCANSNLRSRKQRTILRKGG